MTALLIQVLVLIGAVVTFGVIYHLNGKDIQATVWVSLFLMFIGSLIYFLFTGVFKNADAYDYFLVSVPILIVVFGLLANR